MTLAAIVSTGAALGAEVHGVDVREMDDETFRAIQQAWLDHQVLLFRKQQLTDDELIGFSRRFGTLDQAPVQENGQRFVEGYPEIYVVSNVIENGIAIGSLGSSEAVWHTDMSYVPDPPIASALFAIETPQSGGETEFCSMYAAWDGLPADLQQRVRAFRLKHDGTYNSGGYVRAGVTVHADPRQSPGALHPLAYVHPSTQRTALYLGRRRHAYIEDMPLPESEGLLDELWAHATADGFTWQHRWSVGDLVIWDNRCTMHRRNAFDAAARRIMHRTQIRAASSNL